MISQWFTYTNNQGEMRWTVASKTFVCDLWLCSFCSFTHNYNNQTGITEVKKFTPNWNYGPTTVGFRMPWLPYDDENALLTTSDRLGKEWFGTIVSRSPLFNPSPWMMDTNMNNPRLIWYWMKEAPSLLKRKQIFNKYQALKALNYK